MSTEADTDSPREEASEELYLDDLPIDVFWHILNCLRVVEIYKNAVFIEKRVNNFTQLESFFKRLYQQYFGGSKFGKLNKMFFNTYKEQFMFFWGSGLFGIDYSDQFYWAEMKHLGNWSRKLHLMMKEKFGKRYSHDFNFDDGSRFLSITVGRLPDSYRYRSRQLQKEQEYSVIVYFPNNYGIERYKFSGNEEHGFDSKVFSFYDNGFQRSSQFFEDGNLHGKMEEFPDFRETENNRSSLTARFQNGVISGVVSITGIGGVRISCKYFNGYRNGKMEFHTPYPRGKEIEFVIKRNEVLEVHNYHLDQQRRHRKKTVKDMRKFGVVMDEFEKNLYEIMDSKFSEFEEVVDNFTYV